MAVLVYDHAKWMLAEFEREYEVWDAELRDLFDEVRVP
jgi:hypothetical protein